MKWGRSRALCEPHAPSSRHEPPWRPRRPGNQVGPLWPRGPAVGGGPDHRASTPARQDCRASCRSRRCLYAAAPTGRPCPARRRACESPLAGMPAHGRITAQTIRCAPLSGLGAGRAAPCRLTTADRLRQPVLPTARMTGSDARPMRGAWSPHRTLSACGTPRRPARWGARGCCMTGRGHTGSSRTETDRAQSSGGAVPGCVSIGRRIVSRRSRHPGAVPSLLLGLV